MEFETDNYALAIRVDDEEKNFYAVVNKETHIVEYEDNILPRTIDALLNLQELLNEAEKRYNSPQGELKLVKNIDDGETGLH